MLRWIVRQLSAKSGRNVSFAEAARILREELEENQRCGVQTDQAKRELINALRLGTLQIWAKRDLPRQQANPAAQYEAVDVSLFLDELVSLTEWNTIGPDPEHPTAIFKYRGSTFREARLYRSDVLRLWPAQQTAASPQEPRFGVPVVRDPRASPSDDPVELVISEQRAAPPSSTLPWAVFRIMEQLGYPPDRAWNLLHQAMCANELTPRWGKLWAPGEGPKLEQWERDNLHFDFRRYQAEARSGGPVGSLRTAGREFHPHEITIPPEEVEHWLASQASAHGAGRSTEPSPPQCIVAWDAMHGRGNLPHRTESVTEAAPAAHLASERRWSFARLASLGRLNERLALSPEWVNGDKLADWWARQGGAVTGKKRRQLYDEACRSIFRGVLAGEFSGHGPHPHLVKHGSVARVLPAGPNVAAGTWFSGDGEIDALREHVKVLWLPAFAVQAWLATHLLRSPPWLLSEAKPAPSGFLYIDVAVDLVQQRLGWSQGRASASLMDAFASGEIATRRKHAAVHAHFDRENWRGARLDIEGFLRQQNGRALVLGREYHLHRFLVDEADFDAWLRTRTTGSDMKEVRQASNGNPDARQTDHQTAGASLIDKLRAWFAEWSAQNPQHSEAETTKAAKAKFPNERITRQMLRDLRKPPEGNPLPPGKKAGKSHAEHDRRMRP